MVPDFTPGYDRRAYEAELWWVRFSPPCRALKVRDGPPGSDADYERTAVTAALFQSRVTFFRAPCDEDGLAWLTFEVPGVERLVCHEAGMPRLMGVVRRTGCHGGIRKAGTEREYRF